MYVHDMLPLFAAVAPESELPLGDPADVQLEVVAPVVDTRQRAARLITALGELAHANQLRGFGIAHGNDSAELIERYGDDLDLVAELVSFNMHTRLRKAKEAFKDAYEMSGDPVDDDDPLFRRSYAAFYGENAGTSNRSKRDKYRDCLKIIAEIPGLAQPGDSYVPPDAKAPLAPTQEAPTNPADIELLQGRRANRFKLERLFAQPGGSGVLPATHREKNDAYALLSEQPHDHLMKIHDARLKVGAVQGLAYGKRRELASQAVQSKLYEWGDYIHDALDRGIALSNLSSALETLSAEARLSDIGDTDQLALAALVSYLDVQSVRIGRAELGFDPLRTKEQRFEQPQQGKNKKVMDAYANPSADVEAHVRAMIARLSVGDARELVHEATEIHRNRYRVWHRALRGVGGAHKARAQAILDEIHALDRVE